MPVPWEGHKTADASTLNPGGATAMLAEAGRPRPDLNGLRVKNPARPEIYLIIDGLRRHIPNPDAYNRLFRNWDGVIIDINIDEIPDGGDLSVDVALARGENDPKVYLVNSGTKRWVPDPPTFDRYWFNWGRVSIVPIGVINSIPSGPNLP